MAGKPKILIFASGTKDGGGSGFENLVLKSRGEFPELEADIVAVVSNHEHGGVRKRANTLGIPFMYFPMPYTAENYRRIVEGSGAQWVALSGWLKLVAGLDPARTFNIHPGSLTLLGGRFGGEGMYGHHVHEAVKEALDAGEITETAVTMHFVTDEYDRGPVFFEKRISLESGMSADDIARLVNATEHEWQPRITNMVVHGEIYWDGNDPKTLTTPQGYEFLPPAH